MGEKSLNWAISKTVGQVSEIAVLAPIKRGCVSGERRTYEDCLRTTIDEMTNDQTQGVVSPLQPVSSIHFGRLIIIRPEQYLLYSDDATVHYLEDAQGKAYTSTSGGKIPDAIDEFAPRRRSPYFRSWLLTLVEFDGDIRAYFKDIARFVGRSFDQLYSNCEDFPGTEDFELFWLWIRRYQITTELFYAPYAGLSVARIRQLEAFKRNFDAFVAEVQSPIARPAGAIEAMLDGFLRENLQYPQGFPAPSGAFSSGGSK